MRAVITCRRFIQLKFLHVTCLSFIPYENYATAGYYSVFYWIKNNFIHSKEYMIEQLPVLSNTKAVNLMTPMRFSFLFFSM